MVAHYIGHLPTNHYHMSSYGNLIEGLPGAQIGLVEGGLFLIE